MPKQDLCAACAPVSVPQKGQHNSAGRWLLWVPALALSPCLSVTVGKSHHLFFFIPLSVKTECEEPELIS